MAPTVATVVSKDTVGIHKIIYIVGFLYRNDFPVFCFFVGISYKASLIVFFVKMSA
jgi:hypothetical protein